MDKQADEIIGEMRDKFRTLFAGGDGREVLKYIMASGRVTQCTFAADPFLTAYNEGRRGLALEILGMCESPDEFVEKVTYGTEDWS